MIDRIVNWMVAVTMLTVAITAGMIAYHIFTTCEPNPNGPVMCGDRTQPETGER